MLPFSIRRRARMALKHAIILGSVSLGLLSLAASAQQPNISAAVAVACNANTRGSATCPNYTAPAATAVPSTSMDGSTIVAAATSTTLFNGKVPPNAFIVQTASYNCFVNDNGPASGPNGPPSQAGFFMMPFAGAMGGTGGVTHFITPPGYKPMGPVSIWCDGPAYVAARGW